MVYVIKCRTCNRIYIGEAGRRLGDRFREHLRSTRQINTDLPVGRHFASPSHACTDMLVSAIRSGFRDAQDRRRFEAKIFLNTKRYIQEDLRTFALIVCAQPFGAGNATVICHASLRLTGPEDKHGVENAGKKISGRVYSFGSSVTPIFLIVNHLLYLLFTKYDKMKKISP